MSIEPNFIIPQVFRIIDQSIGIKILGKAGAKVKTTRLVPSSNARIKIDLIAPIFDQRYFASKHLIAWAEFFTKRVVVVGLPIFPSHAKTQRERFRQKVIKRSKQGLILGIVISRPGDILDVGWPRTEWIAVRSQISDVIALAQIQIVSAQNPCKLLTRLLTDWIGKQPEFLIK